MIHIKPVINARDEKAFRNFTDQLYKNCQYYVPLLKLDLKAAMSRKHPFFQHGDAQFFLAYDEARLVGRICVYENKKYSEYHKEPVGFFGLFECINSQPVANALFDAAKAWLKARGLTIMRGSRDHFSVEPQGILIDGFECLAPAPLTYNLPYYQQLFEDYGFHKQGDYYAYEGKDFKNFPLERGAKMLKRIAERSEIVFRPADLKNLDAETEKTVELFNIVEVVNGKNFIPITFEDTQDFVKAIKPLLFPGCAYFAEHHGKTIGFILAIPDAHELLRAVKNGRLFPFGIFKLLRIKTFPYRRLRIVLLGVRDEYKKLGLGPALAHLVLTKALEKGYKDLDMSMIDENNQFMRNFAENMPDVHIYKTYRVYEIAI